MKRFAVVLATLVLIARAPMRAADSIDPLPAEIKRLIDAYSILEAMGADPVNSEQAFYQGAIPGMLRKLDPHSVFFDPGQFEQLKQMQNSTSKGFGSVVSVLPGRVIVLQALPGTPSAKSGIAPGDEILAINGIRLDRLNLDQLIEVLIASFPTGIAPKPTVARWIASTDNIAQSMILESGTITTKGAFFLEYCQSIGIIYARLYTQVIESLSSTSGRRASRSEHLIDKIR